MKAFNFMLGLLSVVQISSAKVIYVDDDASAGGDGSSWSSAHKYLQDAIAVAESGDEVWVAEGTYKPDQGNGITTGDRTASFTLDGISLYGGFVGSETTNTPAGSYEKTILSGEIDSNSSLWSLHVVSISDSTGSLNGVNVTKGNANGSGNHANGGGVRGGGTFTNCTFTNNSASNQGGGVIGSGTFTNCTFTNNTAGHGGGGVFYGGLYPDYEGETFTNCIFANNSALRGGGVFFVQFNPTLNNCTFTKNSAVDAGGVFVDDITYRGASATLKNCIFWKNFTSGVDSENAFSADPLFVNIDDPIGPDGRWFTADDGLRLRSGSPAIDAGNNAYLPADSADLDHDNNTTELLPSDIAGYRRIHGSAVDLGAYEYGDELMPPSPQYSISAIATTGGTVSGGGTFDEDASVTLTATQSNSGYIFSGWSGDASGTSNPLTITADSDKTITANFSKDVGDDDGDGISNYEEIVTHGTSKSSNDSDGDGLTDKEETDRGLNPNSSDKAIIDAVMELKGMKADNVTPIVSGWYYVPDQGWFWTNKDAYPYTYSATDKDWMYFQSGNDKPKFYRYKTKTWLTVE
jgi:uncharacterized repeat protein (TIGR02543 family)